MEVRHENGDVFAHSHCHSKFCLEGGLNYLYNNKQQTPFLDMILTRPLFMSSYRLWILNTLN